MSITPEQNVDTEISIQTMNLRLQTVTIAGDFVASILAVFLSIALESIANALSIQTIKLFLYWNANAACTIDFIGIISAVVISIANPRQWNASKITISKTIGTSKLLAVTV